MREEVLIVSCADCHMTGVLWLQLATLVGVSFGMGVSVASYLLGRRP